MKKLLLYLLIPIFSLMIVITSVFFKSNANAIALPIDSMASETIIEFYNALRFGNVLNNSSNIITNPNSYYDSADNVFKDFITGEEFVPSEYGFTDEDVQELLKKGLITRSASGTVVNIIDIAKSVGNENLQKLNQGLGLASGASVAYAVAMKNAYQNGVTFFDALGNKIGNSYITFKEDSKTFFDAYSSVFSNNTVKYADGSLSDFTKARDCFIVSQYSNGRTIYNYISTTNDNLITFFNSSQGIWQVYNPTNEYIDYSNHIIVYDNGILQSNQYLGDLCYPLSTDMVSGTPSVISSTNIKSVTDFVPPTTAELEDLISVFPCDIAEGLAIGEIYEVPDIASLYNTDSFPVTDELTGTVALPFPLDETLPLDKVDDLTKVLEDILSLVAEDDEPLPDEPSNDEPLPDDFEDSFVYPFGIFESIKGDIFKPIFNIIPFTAYRELLYQVWLVIPTIALVLVVIYILINVF